MKNDIIVVLIMVFVGIGIASSINGVANLYKQYKELKWLEVDVPTTNPPSLVKFIQDNGYKLSVKYGYLTNGINVTITTYKINSDGEYHIIYSLERPIYGKPKDANKAISRLLTQYEENLKTYRSL